MSRSLVPSVALLRAFARPSKPLCVSNQTRSMHDNFMPRHKYAKVNRLDKLHRQQKVALRQEKEESQTRAALLEQAIKAGEVPIAPRDQVAFHIGRTSSKNFAVYESTKGGGTKHITTVRRLSGDLVEMQSQLRAMLQLPEQTIDNKGRKREPVSINHLTQHIVIKGWRGAEVKKWAETLGF